jgi:hypothetical protein
MGNIYKGNASAFKLAEYDSFHLAWIKGAKVCEKSYYLHTRLISAGFATCLFGFPNHSINPGSSSFTAPGIIQ